MEHKGTGETDRGLTRSRNEDAFITDDALGLYAVADGIGGAPGGRVASRAAIEAVQAFLQTEFDGPWNGDLRALVRRAVVAAHAAVRARAQEEEELASMGTTLTLVLVRGERAVMGHVGDSRLYLLRERALHRLSTDHTVVQQLIDSGCLEPENAPGHEYSNVLSRYLGADDAAEPDVLAFSVRPGDRMLLCTDGLSDCVAEPEDLVADLNGAFEAIPSSLIRFANGAGGRDNITAVVVDIREGGEDRAPRWGFGAFRTGGFTVDELR